MYFREIDIQDYDYGNLKVQSLVEKVYVKKLAETTLLLHIWTSILLLYESVTTASIFLLKRGVFIGICRLN